MNLATARTETPMASRNLQPTPIVCVVDDDVSVRESLEALVLSMGLRVETYERAEDFLGRSPIACPACLILDVALPELNGLELQDRMASDGQLMPIIFITGFGDVPMSVKAMKAGAFEFLTKPLVDEVLVDAIKGAIEASRSARALDAERREIRACYDSLTRREREVMELVVAGRLNKQIGAEIGISEITVKAHRGQVMRKMRVRSLADLVKAATRLKGDPSGG